MNTYRPRIPRVALSLISVASAAATIGLAVMVPARMGFHADQVPVAALRQLPPQATAATAPSTVVTTIDVHATREPRRVTVVESNNRRSSRLHG